ncbi:COMM domain [Trinorchestia longiramus]|nr:COMM domain [Trinorchestia longiramus]
MEISSEVSAGLKALTLCNLGEFNNIVELAVQDLVHIAEGFNCNNTECCSHSTSYSSLLVVFTELSKRNLSAQHLVDLLQDLDWPEGRIDVVSAAYEQVTRSTRRCLTSVASLLPHVVDVDWKLLHTVSGGPCSSSKESTYLLRLTVRIAAPGGSLPSAAPGGNLPSAAPGGNLPSAAPGGSLPSAATSTRDQADLQHVTLRCSLQQLIAVTDSLRRAVATVNKLAGDQ